MRRQPEADLEARIRKAFADDEPLLNMLDANPDAIVVGRYMLPGIQRAAAELLRKASADWVDMSAIHKNRRVLAGRVALYREWVADNQTEENKDLGFFPPLSFDISLEEQDIPIATHNLQQDA